jgi:non-specific serine/threonine protein kinase/serine/threonine-protein kinase
VVLYELLTGVLPFDRETVRRLGVDAIRRTIREKEPPRPSTRVTSLGTGSGVAAARGTDAARLARQLRGDLDWIVLKALEKDRTRRYATPNTLAADVGAYLRHDPVSAAAPGALYRAGKFARRHCATVCTAAAFGLLLIAFAVAMTVQAARVARERDRASDEARAKQQVADFLQDLFRLADPARARSHQVTAREILEAGVRKLDTAFIDQPAVRVELIASLGQAHEALGLYAEAERLMRSALALRSETLGADHPKTIDQARLLGLLLLLKLNRRGEATELLSAALESSRRLLGEDHDETLKLKTALATAFSDRGHVQMAEGLFREVIEKRRASGDARSALVALNNLSGLYHSLERYEDSARLDAEILDARRRTLGEDHPDTIRALNNLAVCLIALRQYTRAEAALLRASELGQKVWGPAHPEFAIVVHGQGELAQARGQLKTADAYLQHALGIYDQSGFARYRPLVLYQLAQVNARLGQPDVAVNYLAKAIAERYTPEGTAPTFRDDPQLSSLRGLAAFEALVATAGASAEDAGAK